MKVLIAGGLKTQNIVDGIERKFSSGGIDFIVVKYIEDIDSIYQRGEYFDRALIIEQCWNNDFEITEESTIRKKLNNFAQKMVARQDETMSVVFLTQSRESAEIVFEETLGLQKDSVILVKAPTYTVPFFTSLVTSDIDDFSDDIVYKADEITASNKNEQTNEYTLTECDTNENSEFEQIENEFNSSINNGKMVSDLGDFDAFKEFNEDFKGSNGDFEELDGVFEEIDVDFEESKDGFEELIGDFEGFDGEFKETDEDFKELDDFNGNLDGFDLDVEGDFESVNDIFKEESSSLNDLDTNTVTGLGNYEAETNSTNNFELHKDSIEINEFMNDTNQYTNLLENEHYNSEQEQKINKLDQIDYSKQEFNNPFDDSDYEDDTNNDTKYTNNRKEITDEQIKATIDALAHRGNSIVVTGCGGCGTSVVAYNLANTIANMGYSCLLVDMDTDGRAQSYISKDNYDSISTDCSNLVQAINSTSGVNSYVAISRKGLHLLTMGLGEDSKPIDKMLNREKLTRFSTLAKSNYNFVIYDMPINVATDFAKEITFNADNIALVMDSSTWGATKTMLSICNIDCEDMQDMIFTRAQLVFNSNRGLNKILGRKIKSAHDILREMDKKVIELTGVDTGYYFQNMDISGILNYDIRVDQSWFSGKAYSDTKQGKSIFTELLCNIVLKR